MSQASYINLNSVSVDFPVFHAASVSAKNRLLSTITGGLIDRKTDGHITVKGLRNVNLEIKQGDRVGVVGHNGAGKTTLLRVLSGIFVPTTGSAQIDGDVVSLINITLGIDFEATGIENIKLRAAMMGIKNLSVPDVERIVEFSGLGDFIEMPFRTYSSGMQLRLAFAVSTFVSPQILIMDEWLSTGDESFRHRAEERMRQIVDATEILILASHSRELLLNSCNRLVWLEHGAVKMDGDPVTVCKVYFGY